MSKANNSPIYKKWWFWVLIVIIIGGVGIGISNSNNSPKKVGENGETSSQTQTNFKVGDVISIDNTEVAVTSVERNYSTGNQYLTPKDGEEYVKVNVSIENKSNDTISFNIYDWSIEDSNGVIETYSWSGSADDSLSSGNLAKGGKKTGSIVFEVPANDTSLKLHYKPSFWSNKEVIIHL